MTSKRIPLQPAYVLSHRPYRETSVLLEAFAGGHGRVGLVARGARGPKARLRGVLQPFQRLLLSWNEGGDLGTLTGAEAEGPVLLSGGERVFLGWYVNELLLRLLARHDPHPQLFGIYEHALSGLGGEHAETALRIFEKGLLAELGYGVVLPKNLDPEAWYDYEWDRGPRPSTREGAPAYRGASLLALAEERLEDAEALRDAKRLLRTALTRQLGERELETPRMLRALRKMGHKTDESAHA